MDSVTRGMNPVAMKIINSQKEYWLSQFTAPVLEQRTVPSLTPMIKIEFRVLCLEFQVQIRLFVTFKWEIRVTKGENSEIF